MATQTREQCLIGALYDPGLRINWKTLWEKSHVQQLSGMLLRHGLIQVVAFLTRKANGSNGENNEDERLVGLLEKTMRTVLTGQTFSLSLDNLAQQDALTLLGWNELAIEAAHWIEQVAAAKQ